MLKKDNCILLSNFNLYTESEGLQLTNHAGKIYFKNNTSINVVKDFNCVHDGFEFIGYQDIISNKKYNNLAFGKNYTQNYVTLILNNYTSYNVYLISVTFVDIIVLISSKPKLKAIYYRKKTLNSFRIQASKFKVMFVIISIIIVYSHYLTHVNIIYLLNSGDEVDVILWEDDVDKLDTYLSHEYIQNEPIVLIIQLAKINTWGSKI